MVVDKDNIKDQEESTVKLSQVFGTSTMASIAISRPSKETLSKLWQLLLLVVEFGPKIYEVIVSDAKDEKN